MLKGLLPEIGQHKIGQLKSKRIPNLRWLINIDNINERGFKRFDELYYSTTHQNYRAF